MNDNKKTPYRILRLRSGQDVITRIIGKSGDKLILERPMQMKVSSIFDGMSHQREILMFRNWLQYTNEDKTKIPYDFIASFETPKQEIVDLYDIEKEKEDDLKRQMEKLENADPIERFKILQETLEAMKNHKENEEPKESKNLFKDMIEPNSIMVNLAIPPEIFFQLINEGILENFDLEHIMGGAVDDDWGENKFSDADTSDEIDREDFGSKWTDWSPNIEDYLD